MDATDVTRTRRHREGWLGSRLTKEAIAFDLTPAALAAFSERAGSICASRRRLDTLSRADFDHPAIVDALAPIVREVGHGGGIAIVRGLPVDHARRDEIEAIYWGIGTHFGSGCVQNPAGDLLGVVADDGRAQSGYKSRAGLDMHVDLEDVVGLLCLQRAEAGGECLFADALSIHRLIESERPDCLEALERGFRAWRRGVERSLEITPYDVPVFACCDGLLSCRYLRGATESALAQTGGRLTSLQKEALDLFDDVVSREAVRFGVQLQPGEAVLFSNYEVLHGRLPFADGPDPSRRRLLLRLWVRGVPPRPMPPGMRAT